MYNLNVAANAVHLSQPVSVSKKDSEKLMTNTNLLKQEAPNDSFEYTYPDENKKSTIQKVVENLNPVNFAKNAVNGVKNILAYNLFLKKDDDAEQVPEQEKSVFQKVVDGVKNYIAYQLFLKK